MLQKDGDPTAHNLLELWAFFFFQDTIIDINSSSQILVLITSYLEYKLQGFVIGAGGDGVPCKATIFLLMDRTTDTASKVRSRCH